MYTFYADDKQFSRKPEKKEIAWLSRNLVEVTCNYITFAEGVGKNGMTFAPATFYNERKLDDFKEEQIFSLDFNSGITFEEIKERADSYHLPLLFAYKTFSWKEEHEKFRIVMGFSHVVTDLFTAQAIILILMDIFPECDKACKDPSRMFFGGRGLLYLNDMDIQLTPEQLFLSFDGYMRNEYGQKHYTEHIRKFYSNYHIMTDKKGRVPVTEITESNGRSIFTIKSESYGYVQNKSDFMGGNEPKRRTVVKNFSWDALYDCCELFRKFKDGLEYYYYPELFHIALNLCCVDGGRKKFMEILHSQQNKEHYSYFDDSKTDWSNTLNDIIKHEYLPKNCNNCPYEENCNHAVNMIATANPSSHTVKITERKEYCSITEAEESLVQNFRQAVSEYDSEIKIIIAQTGTGKSKIYIDMLKNTDESFMIVVPSHDLADEIYNRAVYTGIENIMSAPRLPVLSDDVQQVIDHYYNIGAGELAVREYRNFLETLDKSSPDYMMIKYYLDKVDEVLKYDGHIIITHQRFLYLSPLCRTLENHRIIIDEDILTSVFAVKSVDKSDIKKMINKAFIRSNYQIYSRLKNIYHSNGMMKFDYGTELYIEDMNEMNDISGNVLELLSAREIIADNNTVSYLNVRNLPYKEMIIMSATVNPELYRLMMPDRKIQVYKCKEAEYMGKILQYTDQTYSRGSMKRNADIVEKLKEKYNGCNVITFAEFERIFGTEYHFGGIEGLDILKGQDLCIIGTPNISDVVYQLYGMKIGVSENELKDDMKKLRVQHNGYDFSLYTYENKIMRTIQIWFIESLLEQAVGRARLLRYDCKVDVYSGFPVAQAHFAES